MTKAITQSQTAACPGKKSFLRMQSGITPIVLGLVLAAGAKGHLTAADTAMPGLKVDFGPEGLKSLTYAGKELLAPKSSPNVAAHTVDGKPIKLSLKAGGVTQAKGIVTRTYDNLVIVTEMDQVQDVLNLKVKYTNTGTNAISKLDDQPMLLRFPTRPIGYAWKWGYNATIDIEDAPGIMEANWGMGKLVVCVDPEPLAPLAGQMARRMTIGFQGNYGNNPNNALLFLTTFSPPLESGKSFTFHGSLRFGPSTMVTTDLAKDIITKYAQANPPHLSWPDRRPIGAIMIANSGQKWPTNPRGWFNDPKVDVTTASGKKAFQARLMQYADNCISEMKKTSAQGMVFWDVEGGEMAHPITYMGDPRILPQAAPEMDAVADQFFKKFLDAGLRTGVCIRPSKIISDPNGGWKHQQSEDHLSDIADKIAYAKKRWGCTIFYMDTNVKWPMGANPADRTKGMWQGNATILPSSDLREVCRRHPDVLIFPEFGRMGYYSVCGVYGELRAGTTNVSPIVRSVYPDALMALAVMDGDYLGHWDDLRAGAIAGTVHIFRGWFSDPRNLLVQRMYQEIDYLRRGPSVAKSGPLQSLLADPDPLVRFTAIARLKKPTAGETELLIKTLRTEKDGVVQRKIVEAVGVPGNDAAVSMLVELLKDPNRGLDLFAAQSIGRIGSKVSAKITALATEKDQRLVSLALGILAQFDDPSATPTLLKLSKSSNAAMRGQVAHALGRRPFPANTARLVEMLSDADLTVVIAACNALGKTKDRVAIKPLVDLIVRSVTELRNNPVREAAGDALESITGKQYSVFHTQWKRALDNNAL